MRLIGRYVLLRFEFHYWRTHYDRLTATLPRGHRTSLAALHLDLHQLRHLTDRLQNSQEVIVADIDRDGFIQSHIGPIPVVPLTLPADFLPRSRSQVQLVATGQYLGIKKHHANRWLFLNELKILRVLQAASCHVPSLLNVDFDNLSITMSYVAGPVLQHELAKHSAIMRDRDLSHPSFRALDPREVFYARIRDGRRILYSVITRDFTDRVLDELRKIDAARVEWGAIHYGQIIIEHQTSQPYLIDFDGAGYFPRMPAVLFRVLCDQEVAWFNLLFDTNNPTRFPTAVLTSWWNVQTEDISARSGRRGRYTNTS